MRFLCLTRLTPEAGYKYTSRCTLDRDYYLITINQRHYVNTTAYSDSNVVAPVVFTKKSLFSSGPVCFFTLGKSPLYTSSSFSTSG